MLQFFCVTKCANSIFKTLGGKKEPNGFIALYGKIGE